VRIFEIFFETYLQFLTLIYTTLRIGIPNRSKATDDPVREVSRETDKGPDRRVSLKTSFQ